MMKCENCENCQWHEKTPIGCAAKQDCFDEDSELMDEICSVFEYFNWDEQ